MSEKKGSTGFKHWNMNKLNEHVCYATYDSLPTCEYIITLVLAGSWCYHKRFAGDSKGLPSSCAWIRRTSMNLQLWPLLSLLPRVGSEGTMKEFGGWGALWIKKILQGVLFGGFALLGSGNHSLIIVMHIFVDQLGDSSIGRRFARTASDVFEDLTTYFASFDMKWHSIKTFCCGNMRRLTWPSPAQLSQAQVEGAGESSHAPRLASDLPLRHADGAVWLPVMKHSCWAVDPSIRVTFLYILQTSEKKNRFAFEPLHAFESKNRSF